MATTESGSGGVMGDLSSWRDGPAKQAIVEFVTRVCGADGSEPVPVEDRLAMFDNDGTLWCEKPMPIQLDPTLGHGYLECAYAPMLELLAYLATNAATTSLRVAGVTSCGRSARRSTGFRVSA